MSVDKVLTNLGYKVRDRVTGIEGVIISISFDLTGCVQALITREEKGEIQSFWIDMSRLDYISEGPVMVSPFVKAEATESG